MYYIRVTKQAESVMGIGGTGIKGGQKNGSLEPERRQLEDGDFLIMVTDGVLDTLPTGKQDSLMEEFICQVESQNPGEMAHHILNRVMEYAGAAPLDDMTILVTGIWKL